MSRDGYVEIEIPVKQEVMVEIFVGDIIQSFNELPITTKWGHLASIINNVETEEDKIKLLPEQKAVIIEWLERKLKEFS